ncbi:hypothetical protein U1Q18_009410 [Sarracenia purpurea var. burkii]
MNESLLWKHPALHGVMILCVSPPKEESPQLNGDRSRDRNPSLGKDCNDISWEKPIRTHTKKAPSIPKKEEGTGKTSLPNSQQ